MHLILSGHFIALPSLTMYPAGSNTSTCIFFKKQWTSSCQGWSMTIQVLLIAPESKMENNH